MKKLLIAALLLFPLLGVSNTKADVGVATIGVDKTGPVRQVYIRNPEQLAWVPLGSYNYPSLIWNTSGGGSSGGASANDGDSYAVSVSPFAPSGGFFQTVATVGPLASGKQGMAQMTAYRAFHINLRNSSGAEIGITGAPLKVDGSAVTQPVSAASLPLPTGASTSAKQAALGVAGTPSTDVLSIQGVSGGFALPVSGTFWQATQPVSAASLPLPALASTSTKQSDGTQKTQVVDGSGNVIAATANALNVQCANCSGSGVSAVDESAFTAGTTASAPSGGFFQTTATSNPLTNGQQGMAQMTANRAHHVNLRTSTGLEIGFTGTNLNVQCANCSGSGVSATDETAVTFGTTVFAPGGGVYQTTATSNPLTTGQQGMAQLTINRALHVNLRSAAGVDLAGTAGTSAAPTLSVQGIAGGTTLPISVASLPALPANQSSNIAQVSGTAADVNSGVKSAGTLRVVLATDQPALTNKLLVTPDSVALPANQSVNVAQMNGVATTMGTGVSGTGVQRVVLATDQPSLTNKLLVTPDSVALPANQSTNENQINGVTPLMGNGPTGTGAQRVTMSQDGASVPINVSTATDTQLVALSGSTVIYVTSFDVIAGGTGNITFEYGTGSNCATGKTALTGAYPLVAQAGIAKGSGVAAVLKVPSGNALCVLTSAAVQMSGSVSYIQF